MSDSRQDARAIAAAIASHAEAIEGYALDPSVTDDVFEHEMLGRAHLIEARLGRLRKAVQGEAVSDEYMSQLREVMRRQVESAKSVAVTEKAAQTRWATEFIRKQMGFGIKPTDEEDAA